MKKPPCILFAAALLASTPAALAQNKGATAGEEVLRVTHAFFESLEKSDSVVFRSLFLPEARVYTVREKDGRPAVGSRSPFDDRFSSGTVIKERMKDRGVEVHTHGNAAVVWAPYDLWVNETYSHCGVDVFTLLRTADGWRIASLAYTIEREGCRTP